MLFIPIVFGSYHEALEYLKLPEDTFIIKISPDKESLDHVRPDYQVVYKVGIGLMKSPGHPAGNQMYHRQAPIVDSFRKYHTLPVVRVYHDGVTEYLGMYKYNELRIGMSFEGFKYYQFTLHRVKDSIPTTNVSL